MRGDNGQPINAVYGFCRFLTEFVERSEASHVAVAFDESLSSSFRNDLYPEYKMNRELPPKELEQQFKLCRQVAQAAGLHCVAHERYEADDLIATLAANMREQGFQIAIVTRDKDLTQILREQDFWWDFASNQVLDRGKVEDKFGVPPEIIQDYLGLCGDAVDNIPGVAGVGPKTATALLQAFGSLEAVYTNLNKVPNLKVRGAKTLVNKLREQRTQAELSKRLATLAYDAPIELGEALLRRRSADRGRLREIGGILGGRGDGLFERLAESARACTN